MALDEAIDPPMPNERAANAWTERRAFPKFELLFAALLIAVLAAVLFPAVQSAREATRRSICIGHLKHLAMGVHNFHDTHNGLPPLALGDSRASMFVLILPFVEHPNAYRLFDGGNENGDTRITEPFTMTSPNSGGGVWSLLTAEEREQASRVNLIGCPTARGEFRTSQTAYHGPADLYAGPLGNYAVVFYDREPQSPIRYPDPDVTFDRGWHLHQDPCNSEEVEKQQGAIRLAEVPCDEPDAYRKWKPRDTFARVTDGTSLTYMIGEKYVRVDEAGRYSASQDDQDGSWLSTSKLGGRSYNVARNMGFPLASNARDKRLVRGQTPARGPHAAFGFGSQHSGVTPFARCDGSVVNMKNDCDLQLQRKLAGAQDGLTLGDSDEAAIQY